MGLSSKDASLQDAQAAELDASKTEMSDASFPHPDAEASMPLEAGCLASDAEASVCSVDGGEADASESEPVSLTSCEEDTECPVEQPLCGEALCGECRAPREGCAIFGESYCLERPGEPSVCVECLADDGCESGVCYQHACVPCVVDSEIRVNRGCSGNTPRCIAGDDRRDTADDVCVQCDSAEDCPDGLCIDNACVACDLADNTGCSDERPFCRLETPDAQPSCVECSDSSECFDAERPRCETEGVSAGLCVGCGSNEDCQGLSNTPYCEEVSGACQGCLGNEQCTDPAAAHCAEETVACSPCIQDEDCAHIPDKNVCDAGQCVECTGIKAEACIVDGNDYVCDSKERRCGSPSPINRAYITELCFPCKSDAHCRVGATCIDMEFKGAPAGAFCLPLGTTCNAGTAPYAIPLALRESLDGTVVNLCAISEERTTCPAIREFRDACGAGCPGAGLGDSFCGEDTECTYTCVTTSECPTDSECRGGECRLILPD